MEQRQPPVLRITEPGDAAQVIPYLVGFVPEESLVASIVQNGRVQLTARVDLADVEPVGVVEDLLDRMLARFPGAGVFAVAYTADHHAGFTVLARCDEWLADGCQSMLIDADRWYTPDGRTGAIDPYGTVATQATFHGLERASSRAELAAGFASPAESADLDRQVDEAIGGLPQPDQKEQIIALTAQLIGRHLPQTASASHPQHTPTFDPHDAIQLAVLVQHPAARDLALLSIDRDNSSCHLQLWQAVVNTTPARDADMALYLAGMAAWVGGDGARAAIATERARQTQVEPDQAHPVQLLEGLIDQVVSPSMWLPLRDTILFTADADVRRHLDNRAATPIPAGGWPPTPRATDHSPERAHRKPPTPGIAI